MGYKIYYYNIYNKEDILSCFKGKNKIIIITSAFNIKINIKNIQIIIYIDQPRILLKYI